MQNVIHVTIFINRAPADVYAFASNPRNLSRWAAGLALLEVTEQGDEWVAEAPFGKVKIRFASANNLGVLDHDVELESGVKVHNPMRVSEFTFTLFQQPGMSQQQFDEDAKSVAYDLLNLKTLLEPTS